MAAQLPGLRAPAIAGGIVSLSGVAAHLFYVEGGYFGAPIRSAVTADFQQQEIDWADLAHLLVTGRRPRRNGGFLLSLP